jgi:hypothetical protein
MGITVFPTPTTSSSGGGACPYFWFKCGCSGWTPTKDGCAVIHIIGAGAGVCTNSVVGGGAGGYVRYAAEFSTSDSAYCIVVGAGNNLTGGCSMMCGGSPAWCMIAYGGCCCVGGCVFMSTTADGTNMAYACGGNGGSSLGGGGAVGLFRPNNTRGYEGGNGTSKGGGGGAGIGGDGGISCCCNCNYRIVVGGGGGSAGPGNSQTSQNDAYGTEYMIWSSPGPALVTTPADEQHIFKFITQWGAGGSYQGTMPSQACHGRHLSSTPPGIGGGGAGGGADPSFNFAPQRGGAFAGGGGGGGGSYGGYPGGGGGGGVTCSARCYSVCGGDGAVIVEYFEV